MADDHQEIAASFSRWLRRWDRTLDPAERNPVFVAFELLRSRRRIFALRGTSSLQGALMIASGITVVLMIANYPIMCLLVTPVLIGVLLWKFTRKNRASDLSQLPRSLVALLEGTTYPVALTDLWLTPNSSAEFIEALVLERRRGAATNAAIFSLFLCTVAHFTVLGVLRGTESGTAGSPGHVLFTVVTVLILAAVFHLSYWFITEQAVSETKDSLELLDSPNRLSKGATQILMTFIESAGLLIVIGLVLSVAVIPLTMLLFYLLEFAAAHADRFRDYGSLGVTVAKLITENMVWIAVGVGILPLIPLLIHLGRKMRDKYLNKLALLQESHRQVLERVFLKLINGEDG